MLFRSLAIDICKEYPEDWKSKETIAALRTFTKKVNAVTRTMNKKLNHLYNTLHRRKRESKKKVRHSTPCNCVCHKKDTDEDVKVKTMEESDDKGTPTLVQCKTLMSKATSGLFNKKRKVQDSDDEDTPALVNEKTKVQASQDEQESDDDCSLPLQDSDDELSMRSLDDEEDSSS